MAAYVVALHAGQMAIWNSKASFKVCAAGRRFGKSHVAAHLLIKNAMMVKNEAGFDLMDVSVMYIAPTFDQAKRAVWNKIIRLAKLKQHGGLITNFNTNEGWIDLVSGRRIYVRGADNPESLRGVGLSFVVLDEYADMKEFVWDEIIEPTLLDVEGEALFIGTPKGRNHFYKLFMNALGVGDPTDDQPYNPEAWSDWEAFHFKSSDNPHISQKRLKKVMERSGKSADAIRQELDADFITGGTGVLDSDGFQVVDEVPGIVTKRESSGRIVVNQTHGQLFLTVDPAGFNEQRASKKVLRTDEHVLCLTFVSDQGDWYVLDMQHGRWGPREVAFRIVRMLSRNRPCRLGIEQGALGAAIAPYLEDYMKEFNVYQTPEPLKHGNTKKTLRIEWALQGRLERKQIFLLRGDWNEWLKMQADSFPSPLAHDDGLDALAYVDQMATVTYDDDDGFNGEGSWGPMDEIAGY